jgi:1,4-alpha-glucan branching enzyme
MDFVLALHSHIPYVLHHGRWPHGSDWLCEAALDTYLPLVEVLQGLSGDGVPAPVTLGITPVLASQLASPAFRTELEAFVAQRLEACAEAGRALEAAGEPRLVALTRFWHERFAGLHRLFQRLDGNLPGALRSLEDAGRLELMSSAATHGFLPLLARDESIRFQLAVGMAEHRRLFGRRPAGCWLPECAYRPRGPWSPWPGAPRAGIRRGIEEHLADAGCRYCFVDAHLAGAGDAFGIYGDPAVPMAHQPGAPPPATTSRSPYRAYQVSLGRATGQVSVLVRDPRSSRQVWSRYEGYPGDGRYLEFHKIRWPGGLKLWRVTDRDGDLASKQPYDPAEAAALAGEHAAHFAGLLATIASEDAGQRGGVISAPFDTELFGHWWFEGPRFLDLLYRRLAAAGGPVRPVTASGHLAAWPPRSALRLAPGSWGAGGDFGMWLNQRTAWTWERLWPLEETFWDVAPAALADPDTRPVLAQAARELLLAQASDWQFVISTGAAADYAERRLREHCEGAEALVRALTRGTPDELAAARTRAGDLARTDDLFPDVLAAVAAATGGSRSLAID